MKPKICGIATKSTMIRAFMLGNLQYLSEHGWDCYCLCASDDPLKLEELGDIHYIPVNIKWGFISPFVLFKEIKALYRVFKEERFDIIQYAASNASLCASIAGKLASVPVRINLQWGISYPIYEGRVRFVRKIATKLVCLFSTSNQPDSFSNLQFMIDEGLCTKKNGCVLHYGSACGVNLKKFDINKKSFWKNEVVNDYPIIKEKRVLGFVGRIVKEKGINELLQAFIDLKRNDTILLLVGPMYEDCRIDESLLKAAKEMENVIFVGPVNNPEKYFAAFDFMMLPSYQEGFGMTTLEAAALGVPAIVTNIKGPTDVVTNGQNGLICEVKSVDSLKEAMTKGLTMSDVDYEKMSQQAYTIVKDKFDSEDFKIKFLENRNFLLEESRR